MTGQVHCPFWLCLFCLTVPRLLPSPDPPVPHTPSPQQDTLSLTWSGQRRSSWSCLCHPHALLPSKEQCKHMKHREKPHSHEEKLEGNSCVFSLLQQLWGTSLAVLQSCEEFRHSSSTDPLCVPKIDYSSVLCAYLHIKTVLILSKFRPQSLCSCTYFQPPWKRSLKTQVIFSLWTRAMVQYICNGGTICLHSGEYVECSQRTSHRFW